jgi:hypothetical protein
MLCKNAASWTARFRVQTTTDISMQTPARLYAHCQQQRDLSVKIQSWHTEFRELFIESGCDHNFSGSAFSGIMIFT